MADGHDGAAVHNMGGWVAHWAARAGERLAIQDDDRRLDYAALEARIARLCGWLLARGVCRGDRVALLLGNRSASLEVVLAAARVGSIAVPINLRLSPREIRFVFDDCRPRLLVYEEALTGVVHRALVEAASPPSERLAVGGSPDAYEQALDASTPAPAVEPVSPEDPSILMYTSGTTGAPKGALLPHRKALFNSLNAQLFFGIRSDDRVLVVAPLFHSLGLQILALPALYAGASLVLQSGFDAARVWTTVDTQDITYLGGVPTMYQQLHDELDGGRVAACDLSSLRFCFTAGAAISVELVRAYERAGIVLKQGYGQTETSILCCLEARDAVRKAGSVGQPIFHGDVRVVAPDGLDDDPEQWRDTAPGETGEIVVSGPIRMLGYWERPEATAETLRGDWLRTGDLASVDAEGFVTLVGRARDMYISGGENVYPAEVESALAEHPEVREVAVVADPHPRWGEVGRAHIVLEAGCTLDEEKLLVWARERLASFKLPARFVVESSLPKTASGKVQKHLLRG